jgi:hypothetical protein
MDIGHKNGPALVRYEDSVPSLESAKEGNDAVRESQGKGFHATPQFEVLVPVIQTIDAGVAGVFRRT